MGSGPGSQKAIKETLLSPGGKGAERDPFIDTYIKNQPGLGKGAINQPESPSAEDPNRYYNEPYRNTFQQYQQPFYQPFPQYAPPQYGYYNNSFSPYNSLQYIESQVYPPPQYYSPYMNQFGGPSQLYGPAMQPGGRTNYFMNQMGLFNPMDFY